MPELPEVETTRRCLAPALEGRRLDRVEIRRPRMARRNVRPADVAERLSGARVEVLGRVGKFILGSTDRDITLVLHLGMSGRIQLAGPGDPEAPHTNVVLGTDDGTEVRLVDPRTFGFVAAWTAEELAASSIASLGPDALDGGLDGSLLGDLLRGRSAPVKAILLDQRVLAGVGNIYADESLHRARIHPGRSAGGLTRGEVRRLARSVRGVLEEGLAHGGSTLDDLAYLLPDGRAGDYVARLSVYGRAGEPCRECGSPVERVRIAQRSSHFCPVCQPVA